ncbi:MAG: DEAD/DEAH box helicase family protein [Lachnospiraceae bacterium]|nr:DEAD/DEAH box helicase family protein [Lachnospiraceae bacterium]
MNIESYNLDSLRKLVRNLQTENSKLKELLDKAEIPYEEKNVFTDVLEETTDYDQDQGGRINSKWISDEMVIRFFSLFWGREDVFAKRGKNGGYFPQCDNRWDYSLCPKQQGDTKYPCDECKNRCWTRLTPKLVKNHLLGYKEDGSDVIGIYPLVERSRSGKGAHVWILFSEAIDAAIARNFGFMLLDKGMMAYNLKTFKYYDRMYPCQDTANSLGNLIAIPLQGKALKEGNIAMVGSLFAKGNYHKMLNKYGLVIMDECHHVASNTAMNVMQNVNARYVYGFTATPKRSDNLDREIFMLIGPVRHSYTAIERVKKQGIPHYVIPRYTRTVRINEEKNDVTALYKRVSYDNDRNEMIIHDIREAVNRGRIPVILTRLKEQARILYEDLKTDIKNVFLMYGDNTDKENIEMRAAMKKVHDNETLVLIATGQKIGEGFDFPRLDTLMLAAPVSFDGRLEQYLGRLNRDYQGKKDVIVYDYVDSHIGMFERMYAKRLRTYKNVGFSMFTDMVTDKQNTNAIFLSDNYLDIFERDLVEANERIIISSPDVDINKIDRFLNIIKKRQEVGVCVTVITTNPDEVRFGNSFFYSCIIDTLISAGVDVIERDEVEEHFAVIDKDIVWHGGMNLLGKVDIWDNLMRIKSDTVANELLEIAFKIIL